MTPPPDQLAQLDRRPRGGPACQACGQPVRKLHRVRSAGRPWTAVCALCAASMLEESETTSYGGAHRITRRRRKAG